MSDNIFNLILTRNLRFDVVDEAEPGTPPDPPDPPPDDTYAVTYNMRIPSGAIAEDTSNVLVVIDLTLNDLKSSGLGGEVLSGGNDIRFELTDNTGLGHKRISYNETTGNLVALVNFPTVTAASDTNFRIKMGLAAAPDDQQVPALLGVGYELILDAVGNDLSGNNRNFTNSGVVADSAFFGAGTYDGTDELYSDAYGWLEGLTQIGVQVHYRATAGMVGSNRGLFAIGPDLAGGGSYSGLRYRPASIGSSNINPIFGSFATTSGVSYIESLPQAHVAGEQIVHLNYGAAASNFNMIIDGVEQPSPVKVYVGGALVAPAGRWYIGGSAVDTDGDIRWQDRIAGLWIKSTPYSLAHARFNTAMLWDASGWVPWQIDTGSGYATPTPPPEYAPVPPPDAAPDVPTLPTPLRTVNVSTGGELTSALLAAIPGDEILLASGTYSGNFQITRSGTALNPIVIRSSTVGGAVINGTIRTDGDHTWWWGVKLSDPGTRSGTINHIGIYGSHQKYVGIEIDGWGSSTNQTKDTFFNLSSADNIEICYCKIANARAFAAYSGSPYTQWRFGIRGNDGDALCYQIHVHHNHFTGMPSKPSAVYSSAQADFIETAPTPEIGTHSKQQDDWLIEYNLFENSSEGQGGSIIDIKYGSWVTVRYNKMRACAGRFDLRSGHQSLVESNILDGTQGIGVYGEDHIIRDVRVINGGSISLLRGNTAALELTSYEQVNNCLVECCTATVNVGTQFTSQGTSFLPQNVTINGNVGNVNVFPGSGVTQNAGFACDPSEIVDIIPSQVGPDALP